MNSNSHSPVLKKTVFRVDFVTLHCHAFAWHMDMSYDMLTIFTLLLLYYSLNYLNQTLLSLSLKSELVVSYLTLT